VDRDDPNAVVFEQSAERGLVAAYTGREQQARADAHAAIEAAVRFGA
jgi:hypothetical protein